MRLAWGSNGTIIAPSCFRYIPDENFPSLVNSDLLADAAVNAADWNVKYILNR
ncbi:MAG: hypothetical protein QW728_04245 [Thermoplasmata archaeon]